MVELLLKFAILLEDANYPEISGNYGPKFHRWLPNGKIDSINIKSGHPNIDIELWHERRGFLEHNEIKFDYGRHDVDPVVMSKQGVLQAGPLFGHLNFRNPPIPAINAIRESKIGDPEYIAFAKFIVTEILFPVLSKVIDVYRVNFGQYWIPSIKLWDSRDDTLGAYCKQMNIEWSLDGGDSWAPFLPDNPISTISLTVEMDSHYREYITKVDWQNIPRMLRENVNPSPAEFFFNRACQFKDQGDYRISLIDAVTSLELSIEEFVQRSSSLSNSLIKDMSTFWSISLKARMITMAIALNRLHASDIEKAIDAIDLRHKMIHEGQNPRKDINVSLSCLLKVIASFLPASFYRLPSSHSGNAWAEPDEWKRIYMKSGFDQLE